LVFYSFPTGFAIAKICKECKKTVKKFRKNALAFSLSYDILVLFRTPGGNEE
jgi:predicted acyltransferase